MSAIFIAAVTHAQGPSEDLTAEKQQLAQRKAELEAREKALDKRKKMLAAKERAIANSTPRSREKEKAKPDSRSERPITEEQAKAARAEKKLHEPFDNVWDEAFLEQLGTAAYTPPEPGATRRPRVVFHRHRSIRRLFPRLIGKLAGLRSSVIPVSFHRIH